MATKTHKAKPGNDMTTISLTRSCKDMLADQNDSIIYYGHLLLSMATKTHKAKAGNEMTTISLTRSCKDMLAEQKLHPRQSYEEVIRLLLMPDYHCVIQHGFCLMSVGRSASEALDSARQYLSTPDLICLWEYVNPVHGHMYLLPCDSAVYNAVMSDIDVSDYDVIDGRVCYCKDVIDPTMPTTAYMGIVEDMRALADNCTAYLIRLTDADNVTTPIPVIIYSDGYQYTPHDWQTGYDEIPSDITSIRWVSQDGAEAIMIDGLPHST